MRIAGGETSFTNKFFQDDNSSFRINHVNSRDRKALSAVTKNVRTI